MVASSWLTLFLCRDLLQVCQNRRQHFSQFIHSGILVPRWEGGSSFLLAWCIHMAHSKMVSDLLHVFKVKECIETGFVVEANVMVCEDDRSVPLGYASHGDMDHSESCLNVMFLAVEVLEVASRVLVVQKWFDLCQLNILQLIHGAVSGIT